MPSINCENWIRSAMANGMSPDEIAKNFTAAMNAINSKENEKWNAEREKQVYYNEMDCFLGNISGNCLLADEIAKAVVVMLWDDGTLKDWPLDKIKSYQAFIENFITSSIDTFEQLENLSDTFVDFGKIFGLDIPPVDLGNKELFEAPICQPGATKPLSDTEVIRKFLDQFRK